MTHRVDNIDLQNLKVLNWYDAAVASYRDGNEFGCDEGQEENEMLCTAQEEYEQTVSPSDMQVGGDHYKDMCIQPSKFIYANDLCWNAGNAIKYICRHDVKGEEEDLDKAIHYLKLLKEWEYGSTSDAE